jgi:hypothetical protein
MLDLDQDSLAYPADIYLSHASHVSELTYQNQNILSLVLSRGLMESWLS